MPVWAQAPAPQWSRAFGVRVSATSPAQVVHISRGRVLAINSKTTGTGASSRFQPVLWIVSPQGDSIRFLDVPKPLSHNTSVFGAAELPNGDFLLVGEGYDGTYTPGGPNLFLSSSYHFLTRLDSLGNVRWEHQLNQGAAVSFGPAPLVLPDGGALLGLTLNPAPGTINLPAYRPMLLRIDSTGAVIWQRSYGNYQNYFYQLRPLADGSYALAGDAWRPVPGTNYVVPDTWVQRITLAGDTLRSRFFGNLQDGEYISSLRPTADGGLLLAGSRTPQFYQTPAVPSRGWLVQLDSLDRMQWEHELTSTGTAPQAQLFGVETLAGGDMLLTGIYDPTGTHNTTRYARNRYLARWQRSPGGGPPFNAVWEKWHNDYSSTTKEVQALAPDGRFTFGGIAYRPNSSSSTAGLTHYASIGQPYQPDYCAHPPQAQLGYSQPTPDSLVATAFATPGPRYATVLTWHWTLGDGTRLLYHDARSVRHRYATVPPAGTPVTLTVTNNLGCTYTTTEYPWGRPTAVQQAQALAARTTFFPTPARETATLSLSGLRPQPPLTGEVLDALGRVIKRFTAPIQAGTATAVLDLHAWPAGLYVLRLQAAEGNIVKRLVKQD
jgi:hypothetical protein